MKIKKIPSSKPRSEIVVDNIFMFLEKKHLKQKDLAEVCLVNASDVSKWKSYKTKINMDDLEKIANFLQVSIDDLFYTEDVSSLVFKPSIYCSWFIGASTICSFVYK